MLDDPDIQSFREQIDERLDDVLPDNETTPEKLHSAIRFSVLNGGKRLRPIITLATGGMFSHNTEGLLPAACAIECIHAYSLIHDDLPSMDDDDYRRGKMSCHKKYGEATAILAGDALQAFAFQLLTETSGSDLMKRRLTDELSRAAGSKNLVGGQQLDLDLTGRVGTIDDLKDLHSRKTGALILASFRMGVIAGNGSKEDLERLTEAGKPIGLAFQIVDDILDVKGSRQELGKTAGKDQQEGKLTYPSLLGLEESEQLAEEQIDAALNALEPYGPEAEPLRKIANFIIQRNH